MDKYSALRVRTKLVPFSVVRILFFFVYFHAKHERAIDKIITSYKYRESLLENDVTPMKFTKKFKINYKQGKRM